ncbi:hypothetical protein ACU4GD_36710 [Cupriavidus basilensis]
MSVLPLLPSCATVRGGHGDPLACRGRLLDMRKRPPVPTTPRYASAVSETRQGVRVSAAVLGTEDSKRMFGADINKTNVQPVWFEVHNGTSRSRYGCCARERIRITFRRFEVAWSLHGTFSGATECAH